METWFTIVLLAFLGFALLLFEFFVIPGFGLAGFSGLGALALALYLAFTKYESLWPGWGALIGTLVILFIFFKSFPHSKFWGKMRLSAEESSKSGFDVSLKELENLVGKKGTALTMLRPAGAASIEGKRIDVITEGIFLPKGTEVSVTVAKGNKVIVRKI